MILRRLGTLALTFASCGWAYGGNGSANPLPDTTDSLSRKVHGRQLTGSLKPAFEANVGQADSNVRFLSRGRGSQLYLTSQEAVLRFGPALSQILRLRLRGANIPIAPQGMELQEGRSNYFIGGDSSSWQ